MTNNKTMTKANTETMTINIGEVIVDIGVGWQGGAQGKGGQWPPLSGERLKVLNWNLCSFSLQR